MALSRHSHSLISARLWRWLVLKTKHNCFSTFIEKTFSSMHSLKKYDIESFETFEFGFAMNWNIRKRNLQLICELYETNYFIFAKTDCCSVLYKIFPHFKKWDQSISVKNSNLYKNLINNVFGLKAYQQAYHGPWRP